MRRLGALVWLACLLFAAGVSGVLFVASAEAAGAVQHLMRIADPDTSDSYIEALLGGGAEGSNGSGGENAGRMWADKTVVAQGERGRAEVAFDMETDGIDATISDDSDFLHEFSVLGSGLSVQEGLRSPVDLSLVLDVSSSMSEVVGVEPFIRADEGTWVEDESVVDGATPGWRAYDAATDSGKTRYVPNSLSGAVPTYDANFADTYDASTRWFDGWHVADPIYAQSRMMELTDAVEDFLDLFMASNPENRFSITVYDNAATVIAPMAHYEPNTVAIDVGHSGQGRHYKDWFPAVTYHWFAPYRFSHYVSEYDTDYNPDTNPSGKMCYSVHASLVVAQPAKEDWTDVLGYDDSGQDRNYYRVNSDGTLSTVDASSDPATELVWGKNQLFSGWVSSSGTNSDAGLSAGLLQLANEDETTWSGSGETMALSVPRIPTCVLMTDGGSNSFSHGQWYNPHYSVGMQYSERKNVYGGIMDTKFLLTAGYLKAVVERNYAEYSASDSGAGGLSIYTVGVDLRSEGSTTSSWYSDRLYPMLDPKDYFDRTSLDALGSETLRAHAIDDETLGRIKAGIDLYDEVIADASDKVTRQFEVFWEGDAYFQQLRTGASLARHIAFEDDAVNASDLGFVSEADGLANAANSVPYNRAFHGWDATVMDAQIPATVPAEPLFGTATFLRLPTSYVEGGVDGYWGSSLVGPEDKWKVPISEVGANKFYNRDFFDVSSSGLADAFDEIVGEVIDSASSATTPVGGFNDQGVADSITYEDPLGLYMKVDGVSDVVLFGTDYGVSETAIYDYSWNDAYMSNKGAKDDPFTSGWYKGDVSPGDGNAGVVGPYDKGYPPGCADSAQAWADGYVFRVDFRTAQEFVPTLSKTDIAHITDRQKHTVYRFYRISSVKAGANPFDGGEVGEPFAVPAGTARHGSQVVLRNPCYDRADNVTYRLGDIRIWTEDTGDWSGGESDLVLDAGFSDALFVNVPVGALPIQRGYVAIADGNAAWGTNLGGDVPPDRDADAAYAQSTPLRVLYGVSVDSALKGVDGRVDLTKVPTDYIVTHKADGKVWFASNWWSQSTYDGYFASESVELGDPSISFSAAPTNAFYVYQDPEPVYLLAGVPREDSGLSSGLDLGAVAEEDADSTLAARLASEGLVPTRLTDVPGQGVDAWYVILSEKWVETGEGTVERHLFATLRRGTELSGERMADTLCWYDPDQPDAEVVPLTDPKPSGDNIEVRIRPGSAKGGDLYSSILAKKSNPTRSSPNVRVPTVSSLASDTGYVVDVYLGNEGILELPDTQVALTKEVKGEDAGKDFDFEVYVEGLQGPVDAIAIWRNPLTGLWQRRVQTLDLVLDSKGHLVDAAGDHIVIEDGGSRYWVQLSDDEGDGSGGGDFVRRVREAVGDEGDATTFAHSGMTVYVAPEAAAKPDPATHIERVAFDDVHPLGLIEFWVDDATYVDEGDVANVARKTGQRLVVATIQAAEDDDLTSATDVSSPYRLRSTYVTRTVTFGTADPWAGKSVHAVSDDGSARDVTDGVAVSTAHVTLKADEGLLFRGLDSGTAYRVSERLDPLPDPLPQGKGLWDLDGVEQVRQSTYLEYSKQGEVSLWGTHDGTDRTEGAGEATGASMTADAGYALYSVTGDTGEGEETVRFTNVSVRADDEVEWHPFLKKEVRGDDGEVLPDWDFTERPFTFDARALDDAPAIVGESSQTTGEDGFARWDDVTFTKPGTYRYEVRERSGAESGVLYDTEPHTFEVTVDFADDGALHVTQVTFDGTPIAGDPADADGPGEQGIASLADLDLTDTEWHYMDTVLSSVPEWYSNDSWKMSGFDWDGAGFKVASGSFGDKSGGLDLGTDSSGVTWTADNHLPSGRCPTVLFAKEFTLSPGGAEEARDLFWGFDVGYDDAVRVWVNGQLIGSVNGRDPWPSITEFGSAAAVGSHPNTASFSIPGNAFKAGDNVIAFELKQRNAGSSDFWFSVVKGLVPARETVFGGREGTTVLHVGRDATEVLVGWQGEGADGYVSWAECSPAKVSADSWGVPVGSSAMLEAPKMARAETVETGVFDGGTSFTARMTGLRPGHAYAYRVQDADISRTYAFFIPADDGELSFIAAGDAQTNDESPGSATALFDDFARQMGDVHSGDEDLFLSLGDQTDHQTFDDEWRNQYRTFLSPGIFRSLPLGLVQGNHEHSESGGVRDAFYRAYPSLWDVEGADAQSQCDWWTYRDGTLILYVNANRVSRSAGNIAAHKTFVEDAIRLATESYGEPAWIIACLHQSPYSANYHADARDRDTDDVRNRLMPIFQEAGVDLVFGGHDHGYVRSYPMVEDSSYSSGDEGKGERWPLKPDTSLTGNEIVEGQGIVGLSMGSSSGNKYNPDATLPTPWVLYKNPQKTPTMASVDASATKMEVTVYEYFGGKVHVLDTLTVKKPWAVAGGALASLFALDGMRPMALVSEGVPVVRNSLSTSVLLPSTGARGMWTLLFAGGALVAVWVVRERFRIRGTPPFAGGVT